MITIDLVLYLVAFVLLVIAGIPAINKGGWRLECFAGAALVLSLIV